MRDLPTGASLKPLLLVKLPTNEIGSDRARVRLACTNAIQGAAEGADFAYKGAGVDAIFPGSPFERRFRDMHTLSQQIQSREAHFEAVGRVMLNGDPDEAPPAHTLSDHTTEHGGPDRLAAEVRRGAVEGARGDVGDQHGLGQHQQRCCDPQRGIDSQREA